MRWNRSLVVSSVLLGLLPAAAQAADPAQQVPNGSTLSLGIGAVPLTFQFPDIDLGASVAGGGFPESIDGDASGIGLAVSVGGEVGELGGIPIFVEVAGAIADADAVSTVSTQLSGAGSFALGAGDSAGDSLVLATAGDATGVTADATVTVTDPGGDDATITQTTFSPAGPNTTFLFAQSGTADGGVAFSNVTTDGATGTGAAIGFTADADGFLLAATGDLSEIAVRAAARQDVDYAELEARLIGAVPIGTSGWLATPSIAPAYRYLRRDLDVRTDIFLPSESVADERAAVSIFGNDELEAHYAGGSLGIGAIGPVPGGLLLSLNANAGLLGMFADYRGTSSVTVFGTSTETVSFDSVSDDLDEFAYFARAGVGVSKQLGGFTLSFAGQAEYLSDVPTVRRDSGVALGAPGTLDATGGGGSVSLETDDAVILSGSLSVVFNF